MTLYLELTDVSSKDQITSAFPINYVVRITVNKQNNLSAHQLSFNGNLLIICIQNKLRFL